MAPFPLVLSCLFGTAADNNAEEAGGARRSGDNETGKAGILGLRELRWSQLSDREVMMPVVLGSRPEHGFDQPLGLLSDCHRRIERFLGVLQVIRGQAGDGELNERQRSAVQTALEYFRTAAPRHTADEEESLFPLLRASGDPRARSAIQIVQELEHEHDSANIAHAEVDSLYTQWMTLGHISVDQRRQLSALLEQLRNMYRRHIDVEDQQVFPLAGEVLRPEQLAELGKQMARRRGIEYPMNG